MTTIKSRMKAGTVQADPASEIPAQSGERPDDADPGTPMPLPVPPGGWPADAWTGMGGRFVRDPFTGVRSPAPDVVEPEPEPGAP